MGGNPLKLSIIITYYNLEKYIGELLDALVPQIREGVEVILVDDGSEKPFAKTPVGYYYAGRLKVIEISPNQGASHARNAGLDEAAGEYISFVDGDDVVAKDYVNQILERIEGNPDYIELSWRALDVNDIRFHNKATLTAKLMNPSACTRVFKREFIGDIRFNEQKDSAEDEDFTRRLDISRGKRAYIEKWMYFYRVDRENSSSMRFRQGLSKTRLIIYNYRHVSADMTDLLEEIKREDQNNEVWLFTLRNDIPEIEKYCRVRRPFPTWANEVRGEPTQLITIRERPLSTQIVIYVSVLQGADGITTWIHAFCERMRKKYDITVVYDAVPDSVLDALRPLVRTLKNNKFRAISCDTLLMMRIGDNAPKNIGARRTWQVVHTVNDGYKNLPKRDKYIFVSQASKDSFKIEDGSVIRNMSIKEPPSVDALILVSTCRIDGSDKGKQNDRMIKLAKMLKAAEIPFLWFYFSATSLTKDSSMVRVDPVQDVRPFLRMADYLVQLSDSEAYCYSIAEALDMNVPVITTPLTVLEELGFRDRVDGYVVPFDMDFDVKKLLNRESLKPERNDSSDVSATCWELLLGEMAAVDEYVPEVKQDCVVLKPYFDVTLQRDMHPGEHELMWSERAKALKNMGLIKIM